MKKIIFLFLLSCFIWLLPAEILVQEQEVQAGLPAEGLSKAGLILDSPFYFLKSWKESIQLFFTFGEENKAKQFLHLSEVRLAEYQKMIEKGKTEIAEKTLAKYERQLNQAIEKTEEAKEKGKDIESLATLISEKTLNHQEILLKVFKKAPKEARIGVGKAIEASQKGSEKILENVFQEKRENFQQTAKEAKDKFEALKEKLNKVEKLEAEVEINKERAKEIFLKEVLKIDTFDYSNQTIVALMYPFILYEGDKVSPYLPNPLPIEIEQGPYLGAENFYNITIPQWFFWVDDNPFAKYSHETRFVYIDAESGKFEITEEMWWPLLNGEIIWDDDDYWSKADWVFSAGTEEHKKSEKTTFNLFDLNEIKPKLLAAIPSILTTEGKSNPTQEKECILIVNGRISGEPGKKDFKADQKEIERIFGNKAHKMVSLGSKDDTRVGIITETKNLANECDDVIIYITSHGVKYEDGTDAVSLGGFLLTDKILSRHLKSLAENYPKVKFKVVIDACYSGSFIDQLEKADNVALVITSSKADEVSYGDRDWSWLIFRDPNPRDEGSEFSSGLREDIEEALKDKKRVEELKERAEQNKTSFDIELLKWAFKSAVEKDFGAILGKTHPQKYEKPVVKEAVPQPAPKTKPETKLEPELKPQPQAEFAPTVSNQKPIITRLIVSQLHTSYEETPHRYRMTLDASDPDGNLPLTYQWSINCGYFVESTNINIVEWRYNTPGECINAKVTVKVTDSLGLSDQLMDYSLF